jgi:predicted nucleic acid-binding protein
MVPMLATWHEHHGAVFAEIDRRVARGEPMVLAAHTLAETYAVLTRLPPPRRVAPSQALSLIEATFVRTADHVAALDGPAFLAVLRRAPSMGTAGGRVYDAVIAACAEQAEVSTVLTFNVAHFRPLVGHGIEVLAPPLP